MKFGRFNVDGFLLSMLCAIGLALLVPVLGTSQGPLSMGRVTIIGVGLVFFLHGASLSTEKLRAGAGNWRLHLFVQTSTYVLFGLIGVGVSLLMNGLLPHALLNGFFYLCVLPSTVTSSVALTAVGRGNVAGAVFNATLSSLIGMVLTPVLVSLWLQTSGHHLPLQDQMLGIARELLLPFIIGHLLHRRLGGWIQRHKKQVGIADRGVVVLIVYNAFCDSTHAGLWQQFPSATLLGIALMVAALLAVALTLTTFAARRFGFSVEDEIAGVFCGSKKSLAVGAPMAKLLFAGSNALGLIVLPLIIYHQLQLFTCSVLARRYAARDSASEISTPAP